MSSPTQRSLARLRAEGWFVAITERWNPWSKTRQDLFGFIDLLAIRGNETLAVQTTSDANVSARRTKILGLQASALWMESPSRKLVIHGWSKKGPRGKRKAWVCRVVEINKASPMDGHEDLGEKI